MMHRRVASAFLLLVTTCAIAADDPIGPPRLSDLLTGSGLQMKGGFRYDFDAKESKFNLTVSFKDTKLYQTGVAFENTEFPLGKDPIKFGEAPLKFSFGPGGSEVGGTLLSGLSATPIRFGGKNETNFRFLLGADAQIEKQGQSISFAGFEWVPFGTYDAEKETFIGISGRFDRQSDDNATVKEFVSANIRGRIGFGVQPQLTTKRRNQIKSDLAEIVKVKDEFVPGYLAALRKERGVYNFGPLVDVTFIDAVEDLRGKTATNEEDLADIVAKLNVLSRDDNAGEKRIQLINALIEDIGAENPPESIKRVRPMIGNLWKKGVIAVLSNQAAALEAEGAEGEQLRKLIDSSSPNQPRVSYFAEFDGSVADKSVYGGKSARGILSLNVRVLQDAKNADSPFVWLRYEVGRTLAEPDKNIANLSLTFGVKF